MRKLSKLSGIVAIIAVIALFAGCTNPADEDTTTNGPSGNSPAIPGTGNPGTGTPGTGNPGGNNPASEILSALVGKWYSKADPTIWFEITSDGKFNSDYYYYGRESRYVSVSGNTISLVSFGYSAGKFDYAISNGEMTITNGTIYLITDYSPFVKLSGTTSTVTFDLNGGSGTVPAAWTVNTGSNITLPSGLSTSDYTFDGWNTDASGTGTNYSAGYSYTVTGDVTLYANWEVSIYTITFNANGATSGTVPNSRQVPTGYSTTIPDNGDLSLVYTDFTGWNTNADGSGTTYAAGSSYAPVGKMSTIILYAQWGNIVPFSSVTGFENKLNWLQAHAQSDTGYTVEADADESISPKTFSYSNKSGITITLGGVGANRTVSLSSSYGMMFHVGSGVTLVLDNNITLRGRSDNYYEQVYLNSGGTLRMNTGSAITGNTAPSSSYGGGGVYVGSGATFTMNGGTISGNTGRVYDDGNAGRPRGTGGGVTIEGGTFTMNGGEITSNTAIATASTYQSTSTSFCYSGGGVYMNGGTFTMSGGIISDNTATATARVSSSTSSGGSPTSVGSGGVYMGGGTFTMSGGTISDNTASAGTFNTNWSGSPSASAFGGVYMEGGTFTMNGTAKITGNTRGGVYVATNTTFTMNGGEISGNTASSSGGGVTIARGGTFTMNGGKISDNTATSFGGGVTIAGGGTFTMNSGTIYGNTASSGGGVYSSGTFTMSGGTIYGNTASSDYGVGGGVCVSGTFDKTGGTIYGYNAGDTVNSNVVKNSSGGVQSNSGHAVYRDNDYNESVIVLRKETTAGPGVNLYCSGSSLSGGWEF